MYLERETNNMQENHIADTVSIIHEGREIDFPGFFKAVEVTPEMAADLLKHNTKNRHISEGVNERYARIMKAGNWRFNGEPVIFSDKGTLLDGQNRLKAILKSGITVPMLIIYGVKEENFSTIDQGSKRTAGQVLNILECKRSNTLAAALRLAYIYFEVDETLSCSSVPYVYNEVLLNFLEQHPEIEASVSKVGSGITLCSSSVLAFCHFVFSQKSVEEADRFLKQVLHGDNLHSCHPVLVLRNRLLRNKNNRTDFHTRELIALIFKTWNYCRKTQDIKNLSWHPYEDFPEVI